MRKIHLVNRQLSLTTKYFIQNYSNDNFGIRFRNGRQVVFHAYIEDTLTGTLFKCYEIPDNAFCIKLIDNNGGEYYHHNIFEEGENRYVNRRLYAEKKQLYNDGSLHIDLIKEIFNHLWHPRDKLMFALTSKLTQLYGYLNNAALFTFVSRYEHVLGQLKNIKYRCERDYSMRQSEHYVVLYHNNLNSILRPTKIAMIEARLYTGRSQMPINESKLEFVISCSNILSSSNILLSEVNIFIYIQNILLDDNGID